MSSLIFTHAPNRTPGIYFSASVTTWRILATDGVDYADLATLLAAGKLPWPAAYSGQAGLEPGTMVLSITFKCMATGGITDGSPFFYALNPNGGTTPTDALADEEVSANGQAFVEPGRMIYQLWIRKTVGNDIVRVTAKY